MTVQMGELIGRDNEHSKHLDAFKFKYTFKQYTWTEDKLLENFSSHYC